jgi:tetratricopeptide (TPR) repeat protein
MDRLRLGLKPWLNLTAVLAGPLLLLGALVLPVSSFADVRTLLTEAQQRMREGDAARALALLERAAETYPDSADAHHLYGVALTRTHPDQAVAALRKAVELDTANHAARRALATALLRLGDREAAQQEFERARRIADAEDRLAQAKVSTNRGIQLLEAAQPQAALASLQKALAAEPAFAPAWHYLGVTYGAMGMWKEANQAFARAVDSAPADPEIRFNFGIALRLQGDWDGAVREFRAAVEAQPEHRPGLCALAGTLRHQGDLREALQVEARAARLGACAPSGAP